MADTEQPEHLNAAQMAEVQRHLIKIGEGMQLRKWAVEICLTNGVPPDKVVELAAAMHSFVEGRK